MLSTSYLVQLQNVKLNEAADKEGKWKLYYADLLKVIGKLSFHGFCAKPVLVSLNKYFNCYANYYPKLHKAYYYNSI